MELLGNDSSCLFYKGRYNGYLGYLRKQWYKLFREAGIKRDGRGFHDLKRSFDTHCHENGKLDAIIIKFTGQKSVRMLETFDYTGQ